MHGLDGTNVGTFLFRERVILLAQHIVIGIRHDRIMEKIVIAIRESERVTQVLKITLGLTLKRDAIWRYFTKLHCKSNHMLAGATIRAKVCATTSIKSSRIIGFRQSG